MIIHSDLMTTHKNFCTQNCKKKKKKKYKPLQSVGNPTYTILLDTYIMDLSLIFET